MTDIRLGTSAIDREGRLLLRVRASESIRAGEAVRLRRDDGEFVFAIAHEDLAAGGSGWIYIPDQLSRRIAS